MKYTLVAFAIMLPFVASAASNIQRYLTDIIFFLNDIVVPFLFVLAFLFFIVNAARFFIFSGDNEEGQTNAKNLMIYGLVGMVMMVLISGIVYFGTGVFGLRNTSYICPDYMPYCAGGGGRSSGGGFFEPSNSGIFQVTGSVSF